MSEFYVANIRGHEVEYAPDDDITREFTEMPCAHCGQKPVDMMDACIAHLPGVKFACCGHGGKSRGYIYFENGVVIRGDFRVERMEYDEP